MLELDTKCCVQILCKVRTANSLMYNCMLVASVFTIVQTGRTESRLIMSIVGLAAARQSNRTNYDLKQILQLIAEQIQQTAETN